MALSFGEAPGDLGFDTAWLGRDVALAYTVDTVWRNRAEFPLGREQDQAFLVRKWARELDCRLIKELWAHDGHRIAVRIAYEWRDDDGSWFRRKPAERAPDGRAVDGVGPGPAGGPCGAGARRVSAAQAGRPQAFRSNGCTYRDPSMITSSRTAASAAPAR